jgi:hypothetical protein
MRTRKEQKGSGFAKWTPRKVTDQVAFTLKNTGVEKQCILPKVTNLM